MGKDIFGNELMNLAGVFTAEEGILTFPSMGDSSGIFMVQAINIAQNQNVGTVYDLASNNIMLTKGKPTFGQCTISQIIGPKVDMEGFFDQFGDICNASKNMIDITLTRGVCIDGNTIGKKISLRLYNCFIQNFAIASDTGSYQIRQDVTLVFSQAVRKSTNTSGATV